ncbi:hATC-domain-containing protein, partial [Sistotremastrum suecicum HHB10207 ss-3]
WGGEKEQAAEIAKGNIDAKNWTAEAEAIVKKAVTNEDSSLPPSSPPQSSEDMEVDLDALDDDDYYDHQRRQEISMAADGGHWEREYDDYVKDVARDVERDTDLVRWWQEHNIRYPTLSRLAVDVLPVQASSVACERLFSAAKHATTDQRSRLGTEKLEQLQMLKASWKKNIVDIAEENAQLEEEIRATEELYEGLN